MAQRLLLWTLILALNFGHLSAYALRLEDVPALVSTRNTEVRASGKDVEAATESISAARARHYPKLNIRNTFLHLGETPQFRLSGLPLPFGALPPVELHKQDFFFSTLLVTVPLFAGGRIAAGVDAAKAQRDEATLQQRQVIDEKTREALERYFSVLLAREAVVILNRIKTSLDRIQGISEGLVRSGLGARFSTLQLKVAQADLNARVMEANGKSQVAELAFRNSTGLSDVNSITFDTPLVKPPMPEKADVFKAQALQRRREFAMLKSKEEQANALKALHLGETLPSLYAVGAKQITSSGTALVEPTWAVGVVLDIPLTDWLHALPERERAIRLQEKVEILKSRAEQEIPLQIEKLYVDLLAADGAYYANHEGVALAREALRLAEVRFKNGSGSAVEVLRASSDLEKSELGDLQRTEEFNRKLIELYQATGDVNDFVANYKVALETPQEEMDHAE